MKWDIEVQLSQKAFHVPPAKDLGFGKYFSNQIFTANFNRQQSWHSPKIIPYQNLQMDPAASVLHYGQALFEGLKAFRQKDGGVAVFRPEFNWQRMVQGADRLCMEVPPLDLWSEGLMKLLKICEKSVPSESGTSMYIRPTLIGTEGFLGVRPADEYLFFIILSPVAGYYSDSNEGIKIWIEKEYLRAAPGGLGMTKAAANYAGSLKGALSAKKKGYSQVLWLDVHKTDVQEVGTMNVFFVIGDEVVTPELDGTILEGGTRAAAIQILKDKGYKVSQRKVPLAEIQKAAKSNQLKEAFGTGTAAVISPIGELASEDFKIQLNSQGPIASLLFDEITGIQYGQKPDRYNWMVKVP